MSHSVIRVKRFWRTEKQENTVFALVNRDIVEVSRTIREKEVAIMEDFPEEASLELGLEVSVGVCHGE